ncbi:MAG TPA: enolase C-terminal domain-like protein [Bryobacteraceae bacterium]|nr:enolase C-terminal domain-like protein [Bryobacteraceae bacterium]
MRRREFLASAIIPVIPKAPAITKVEYWVRPYRTKAYFKFFRNSQRSSIILKVTAEDGTVGWGQAVPVETWSYESVEASEVTLKNYLIPAVKGLNPTDLAAVHQAMNTVIRPSFSTGMPMTKAGIDLALHDLAGRLANKSVPEMWGRKPQQMVPLSWTLNPRTLDEVPVLMEEGRKLGYKHYNIKVAPDPKFDIAMAKEVRRHAPNCFLWADANGGYDLETALAVAPRLKDAGVDVLEQPLPANRLTGFAAMKKQGALPIIMDEGLVSSVELEEFIKLKLLDGIAMKPARTAGLWDARKQVQMALDNGLMFLGSGLTDPDLALAATLQLYGAYNLKYPAALNGLQFLAGSFLKKPFELEDGALRVPTGVGLGVEVDEKKVIENETSA